MSWYGTAKQGEVSNIVLPFQVIEKLDGPRAEKPADTALQAGLFDEHGRQLKGWTNKLIWGDNKLILSSLKNLDVLDELSFHPPLTISMEVLMLLRGSGCIVMNSPHMATGYLAVYVRRPTKPRSVHPSQIIGSNCFAAIRYSNA